MHVPSHFQYDDPTALKQMIRKHSFGLLVLADENGIEANHVPFELSDAATTGLGHLRCHLARGNPAWQRIAQSDQVLVVFQGPNAYISPAWYPSKADNGRVVPTWNYLAVHVQGRAQIVKEVDWLKQHLHRLTEAHESHRAEPWSVNDAPPDYLERLRAGIVGIEIEIEAIIGKLKASQNQPESNRLGAKAGLQRESCPQAAAMAALME